MWTFFVPGLEEWLDSQAIGSGVSSVSKVLLKVILAFIDSAPNAQWHLIVYSYNIYI